MVDSFTVIEPLASRLTGDLQSKSPIELMQHARSLVPLVLECDDPAVLSNAIGHAQQIDRHLQSTGIAKFHRNAAAELKLWAMWRLGQWLIDANMRGGSRAGRQAGHAELSRIQLSKSGRSRCRLLATSSAATLTVRIEQIQSAGDCLCLTKIHEEPERTSANLTAMTGRQREGSTAPSDPKPSGRGGDLGLIDLVGHTRMLHRSLQPLLAQARRSKAKRVCDASNRRKLSLLQLKIDMVERYAESLMQEVERLSGSDPRKLRPSRQDD